MSEAKILSVAIPRPLDGFFTYRIPATIDAADFSVGSWVRVPFGRSTTHAYVVEKPKSIVELPEGLSEAKLKDILECGRVESVLPNDVFSLCQCRLLMFVFSGQNKNEH